MNENINNMPNICIIAGPTAIGKTGIAIEVAKRLNCEIISADSAQIYKYMNIGTAKATKEEMQGIMHYMIDEVYPDEDFSVAEFRKRSDHYIEKIAAKGKLPLFVGGTGLYINSLLNNLDFTPIVGDEEFRSSMQELANLHGNSYIHNMLKEIDPSSWERLHPNDLRRVIRALEVHKYTGKTISYFQEESKKQPPKYNYAYFGLNMDRAKLYSRIDKRVEIMFEQGLVNEVEELLNMGYSRHLVSMQALGYKEIISYLNSELSFEDAVTLIKRDSRRYAKRQLTWFRRDERISWIDVDKFEDNEAVIKNIIDKLQEKLF